MKTTPKEFFLNLGAIVTLYWVMSAVIVVLFDIINALLPDPASYATGEISRFSVASIVVLFPLFIFITRTLNKDIEKNPDRAQLPVRRWLAYLTLFIAGVVTAGDLIVVLYSLLGGEITLRFILKVLVVFVVSGGVFWYLFRELKRGQTEVRKDKEVVIGASAFMLAVVAAAIVISGTPGTQRAASFDLTRIYSLQSLERNALSYFETNGALPESAAEFTDPLGNTLIPNDPETGEPLVYEKTSALTFNLCADFSASFDDMPAQWTTTYDTGIVKQRWDHPEGYHCFERVIDPTKAQLQPTKPVAL